MSVNKTWNNIVYSIPNTRGESGWETQLSQYLQALADNAATNIFLKQAIRKATTTPVTVSASTDCTIIVDLAGPGPSTVNLPAGADKQIFVIVDGKGAAKDETKVNKVAAKTTFKNATIKVTKKLSQAPKRTPKNAQKMQPIAKKSDKKMVMKKMGKKK